MPKPDHDIDAALRQRQTPVPPPDFAARIIARAGQLPQTQKSRWLQAFGAEIAELFLIPRPAYALSVLLIVGLLAGTYAASLPSFQSEDWQSYVLLEEDSI